MRVPRRVRPIVALAVLSAAATVGGVAGSVFSIDDHAHDPFKGEWRRPCYDSCATSYSPVPSSLVQQPYDLHLTTVLLPRPFSGTSKGNAFFAVRVSEAPAASILARENRSSGGRDRAGVIAWSSLGETQPTPLCNGRLLEPFRLASSRETRLLCSNPTLSYQQVAASTGLAASDLFVLNYAREVDLTQEECLRSALRAASRQESLQVDNLLEMRAMDGSVTARTRLDPSYNPTTASVISLAGRMVALVTFNSGYQVSESLYRELILPRLRSRKFESPRATSHSYGSFRGLLAIDLESGDVLWERRLGVIPWMAACADLDGDGSEEVLLSVYSPSNGVSACGTTDAACSYVLCLDARGNETWRYRLCGSFLGVWVAIADVNGDGRLDIVSVCASERNPDFGSVSVISGTGDLLVRRTDMGNPGGLVLADVTGDGSAEILTSDTHGDLFIFDGDLRVVADRADTSHAAYERRRLMPVAANDLDGDGETEIVALSSGWTVNVWNPIIARGRLEADTLSYVMVLDHDLIEEARARVTGRGGWGRGNGRVDCLIADIDGNGTNEITLGLSADGGRVFEAVSRKAGS